MHIRAGMLAASFMAALLWIGLLTALLPRCPAADPADPDGPLDLDSPRCSDTRRAGELLVDRNTQSFPYPFTIQNLMWIVFFVAAGELVVRHLAGVSEEDQLRLGLLPEDDETVLRRQDVGPIYSRVRQSDPDQQYWLQRLLTSSMLQFQSTGSIDQVNAIFNSSMDLYQNETELRYNVLRYLVWLIPTLGFVGTVIGIALALDGAGSFFAGIDPNDNLTEAGPEMMTDLTAKLGVAFYTTLLALLQSAGLMFALHVVQGREEGALNRVGQYCLKNLVNRLYERRQ